jgi:hypothetical protein
MRTDRGYSLVELMVATAAALVVFTAIVTVLQVSTRHQKFVADRVAANQRARPVMTGIINDLHSACVAPGVAPVLGGSSDTQLSFISKSTEEVAPIPEQHVVTLTGSTLTESVYPVQPPTDNQPPWTFSPNPSSTRELLDGVTGGVSAEPPKAFQYFSYNTEPGQGGQLSTTPLPTPLSAANATLTVGVKVSFATSPSSSPGTDPKAPITLSDQATMRLEPASEDVSEVNLPCV